MSDGVVHTEQQGHLWVITLDRPHKRNAINGDLTEGLDAALNRLDDDPDLWVGILTGQPSVFSAGTDIRDFGDPTERGGEYGIIRRERTTPLIAAVEGLALGGGFEVALACDVIVAAADVRWGFPEVKRGLVASSGATFRAPRALPLNVARELMLTGDETTTERLERLGVVNRMVPPGQALAAATELAEAMMANSPVAVRESMRAVNRIVAASADDAEAWDLTAESVEVNMASDDRREGVKAFFDKRPPAWTNR